MGQVGTLHMRNTGHMHTAISSAFAGHMYVVNNAYCSSHHTQCICTSSSSCCIASFMPFPPPPKAALTSTGNPILAPSLSSLHYNHTLLTHVGFFVTHFLCASLVKELFIQKLQPMSYKNKKKKKEEEKKKKKKKEGEEEEKKKKKKRRKFYKLRPANKTDHLCQS